MGKILTYLIMLILTWSTAYAADDNVSYLLGKIRKLEAQMDVIREQAIVIPKCESEYIKRFPETFPCYSVEKKGIIERGQKTEEKK